MAQTAGTRPSHAFRRLTRSRVGRVTLLLMAGAYRYDDLLFSYFEYVGTDYDADMERMAADPDTQRWWDVCRPCQQQTEDAGPGEWWTSIPEIFHTD
jgi:hypothetical protein